MTQDPGFWSAPAPIFTSLANIQDEADRRVCAETNAQIVGAPVPNLSPEFADTERADLALAIVNSEAFMWLMVGANHQESWLSVLRPAYGRFTALGGGWGKKPQHNDGNVHGNPVLHNDSEEPQQVRRFS